MSIQLNIWLQTEKDIDDTVEKFNTLVQTGICRLAPERASKERRERFMKECPENLTPFEDTDYSL